MAKKKKGGESEEQKPARIRLPRRSRTSTRERAENRQARHERQAARKAAKLVKRYKALEALLDDKGVAYHDPAPDESVGERYRRLRRLARRHGLVGTPIKARVKRSEEEDAPGPESAQVPETTS